MTDAQAEREAEAPHVPLLEGVCPQCDGSGSLDAVVRDPCPTCAGTGRVRYPPTWADTVDARLEALVSEGRPWHFIGAALCRPVAVVVARAQELGLENVRDRPARPTVIIRDSNGKAISTADPARRGGFV